MIRAGATPSGFFVMRTPLLPIEALAALSEALDREAVRARLRDLISQPVVREAIFVASPDLAARIAIWERDPESPRGQHIERALYCQVARMAGQPTPDGLSAGSSTGTIGAATTLALEGRASYRRHSRLDIGFLVGLGERLGRRRELREQLRHRVNSSLHRAAGRIHVAAAQLDAGTRAYRLVAAQITPYLDATLQRASQGARLAELAEALVRDDPEISLEDAGAFVHELVDAQLLTSPLTPPITGDDPAAVFVEELVTQPGLEDVARRLSAAQQALAALDGEALGAPLDRHRAIGRALGEPAGPPLFQVELSKASPHATLGHQPVAEILRGVEILRRLARPAPAMRRFVEAFAVRYGDACVPLLDALDEDTGIGFEASRSPGAEAAPLVQGLSFPIGETSAPFGPREALLLRRVEELRLRRETVLQLSSGDLEGLYHREPPPLPSAFAVVASIAARSSEAVSRGDFRVVLDRVTGPSGVNLFAGSCHGDGALRARVADHLRAEEAHRPDALFAEIVHLPAGPTGHRVVRPVLRGHEIVHLARSGAPEEAQLAVSDLTIAIGHDEQIVLRSTRLGREIIPRLTAPHDHADPPALGVYRFLCALQHQGSATELRFRWGALDGLGFLPRVQVGRVVLARARWRLFADQLQALVAPGTSRFAAVQRLREQLELPRRVELQDGDHRVPLDLDNPLCVDVLGDRVKHRSDARLFEVYPALDELYAMGPEGRFVHELVIPFVRDAAPRAATRRSVGRERVLDRFTPGTEWLQLNLHTGSSAADDVLRELVAPQVARALRSGTVDRWFFVRYSEPDWHLRLFLHGDPAGLLPDVLPSLHAAAAALLQDGTLWNLQIDTYRREVERYGGPDGIEIAEAIFQADSEAVLGIVELLEGDEGEHARWRLGLRGIDLLLTDLGLALSEKREVMRTVRASFGQTLGVERRLEHQLSANYRRERGSLEALLDPANDQASELAPGIELLHERSRKLAPWVRELDARARSGRLSQTIQELARSYVHMFTNRLFRSAALAQELVLHDWLGRLYESSLARRRS